MCSYQVYVIRDQTNSKGLGAEGEIAPFASPYFSLLAVTNALRDTFL